MQTRFGVLIDTRKINLVNTWKKLRLQVSTQNKIESLLIDKSTSKIKYFKQFSKRFAFTNMFILFSNVRRVTALLSIYVKFILRVEFVLRQKYRSFSKSNCLTRSVIYLKSVREKGSYGCNTVDSIVCGVRGIARNKSYFDLPSSSNFEELPSLLDIFLSISQRI